MPEDDQSKLDKINAEIEDTAAKLREFLPEITDEAPSVEATETAVANLRVDDVSQHVANMTPFEAHMLLAEYDLDWFAQDWFAQYYLSHHFPLPSCDMHKDMHSIMLGLEHGAINKPVIFIAPREHAKTTNFSFLFPLHALCFNKFWHIGLLADIADQAKDHLANIKIELEENERLINDFGQFRDLHKLWSTSRIQTSKGHMVFARGVRGKIRGKKFKQRRPDLLILDDIENLESTQSELQVQRLYQWVTQSAINAFTSGLHNRRLMRWIETVSLL